MEAAPRRAPHQRIARSCSIAVTRREEGRVEWKEETGTEKETYRVEAGLGGSRERERERDRRTSLRVG